MDGRIGALWLKKKGDKSYLTGTIEGPLALKDGEKLNIVVFHNTKTKDTQPDWNILKSKLRESRQDFDDSIPGF